MPRNYFKMYHNLDVTSFYLVFVEFYRPCFGLSFWLCFLSVFVRRCLFCMLHMDHVIEYLLLCRLRWHHRWQYWQRRRSWARRWHGKGARGARRSLIGIRWRFVGIQWRQAGMKRFIYIFFKYYFTFVDLFIYIDLLNNFRYVFEATPNFVQ